MPHDICPVWLGYLLASPLRRLLHDPAKILAPHIAEGMIVLEPGPGMGFFTLEMARRVGPRGRVIAVDVQPGMLKALKRRAAKAGLADRIECRLAKPESMGIADLAGKVDFTLAFAMVHETPSAAALLEEIAAALKPGGALLLVEPSGHVNSAAFEDEISVAAQAGLHERGRTPSLQPAPRPALPRAASAPEAGPGGPVQTWGSAPPAERPSIRHSRAALLIKN